MEIDIIEEKENPLLGRKELKVKVTHDGPVPGRDQIRKKIEALLNAKKNTVIVDTIKPSFGAGESLGLVKVYKSEEQARSIEPAYILEKNKPVEEPMEEAPAAEGEEGEGSSKEKKEEE
jgi:small subunit ribosomal protein S24e